RSAHGVRVEAITADVARPEGQARVIAAAEGVDILVTNVGGPPPGQWRDWRREDFQRALDANMLAPIALIQALLPGMCDRGWGRVVNITSTSVKAPLGNLGLSNAARAGLTGYVAGTARAVAGQGVTINNLLPGSHDTDRIRSLDEAAMKRDGVTQEELTARRLASIPAGRMGTPAEFGAMCAFLCSVHAGYIVGQNIALDGGSTNLTL
ncbi:MAG TPA: SDR family oxidoreductase, partial [Rubellimicrobium sp.]|nr:SDR family oxidoreductase [Rubellimicrobium sp.]